MAAQVTVQIPPLKLPLVGVSGIEILVDGQPAAAIEFGGSVTIDVQPGTRGIALVLHSLITRKSNTLFLNLEDGSHAAVVGKYSRLWGKFKLAMG